jgi:hypothetical protein
MKIKKIALSIATAGLLAFPSVISADEESNFSWLDRSTWGVETSGELIGKLGGYIDDGKPHNPKVDANGNPKAADLFKSEVTAKLFLNQRIGDETSWHAGLQFNHDDSQIDGYRTTRQDSQFDWLRELYIDTKSSENMSWRLGKQQVVWGKADGVKFLDIINPTDFRHWGQDSMEDSRIPLWMINGEYALSDNSSLQVIYVLQHDVTNQIPGLYNPETGDQGQPFVPIGMDTMLGRYNGFMHIGNDMGRTAGVFQTLLSMGGMSGLTGPMALTTVEQFTSLGGPGMPTFQQVGQGMLAGPINPASANGALLQAVFLPLMSNYGNGNNVLNAAANQAGSSLLPGFAGYMGQLQGGLMTGTADGAAFTNTPDKVLDINGDGLADTTTVTNALNELGRQMTLAVAQGMNIAIPNPTNLFDPANMPALNQLATNLGLAGGVMDPGFNNAIQMAAMSGMQNTYFQDGSTNQFSGTLNTNSQKTMFDYMGDTTFGTFNAFQGMKTKYVRAHEKIRAKDGNLGIKYAGTNDDIGLNYTFNYYYHFDNNPVIDISWEGQNGQALKSNVTNGTSMDMLGNAYKTKTVNLVDANNNAYNGPATMVFTETQNRINTFGLSFDYAIDNPIAPVILRSEIVYDKGTLQPVVDLGKLAYGDIDNAFTVQKADFVNYVIGLDITVLTNLFVSFQFMDKWNLDYVDEKSDWDGVYGNKSYGKFTANPATMSMSNGFRKAEEHQIMYTFFLSKPFMESDALRVNNIFLLENEGGGFWDRFDFEYSYSDSVILSAAVNVYGGDQYGVFGQFKTVSNAEVGFKYLF